MLKSCIYRGVAAALWLLWLAPGPALRAQTTNVHARWEESIAAFEQADRTNPPPKNAILFTGSSSIRMWKTLAQDFPQYQVINRGFGGSQIADVNYFIERVVLRYEPRLIVLYCGGNDINAKKTAEAVFQDYRTFVETVGARLPNTRIAYISIAPNPARWSQIEQVKAANRMIEEHARGNPRLAFINVFPHMLGPDGQPKADIFLKDRLHMNEKGYAIWKDVVGEFLRAEAGK